MFVVTLKFAENKTKAPDFMQGHNEWIARGFAEGVFLLAGSLPPGLGGAILVDGLSRSSLEERLLDDPFVAEGVVSPEILEINPGRTDERLAFLKA